MPAALASKDEIIDRLFVVFRDRGFEGTSLADLSRATGLGKSSLYHHFPDGKTQMAEVVLARAAGLIDTAILDVARAPDPLKTRLRKIVAVLEQLYGGGRTLCVLGQLSAADVGAAARQSLQRALEHWIKAIESLARESGMSPVRARAFAEDWVARLQGALILQAATASTDAFERALQALSDLARDNPAPIES